MSLHKQTNVCTLCALCLRTGLDIQLTEHDAIIMSLEQTSSRPNDQFFNIDICLADEASIRRKGKVRMGSKAKVRRTYLS